MVAPHPQIRRFAVAIRGFDSVRVRFLLEIAAVSAVSRAKQAAKSVIKAMISDLGQPPPSFGKTGAALDHGFPAQYPGCHFTALGIAYGAQGRITTLQKDYRRAWGRYGGGPP
jgi:hypothetical protein